MGIPSAFKLRIEACIAWPSRVHKPVLGSLPSPWQTFADQWLAICLVGQSFQNKKPLEKTQKLGRPWHTLCSLAVVHGRLALIHLGDVAKIEAWILRDLIYIFSRAVKRGHKPREPELLELMRAADLPIPSAPSSTESLVSPTGILPVIYSCYVVQITSKRFQKPIANHQCHLFFVTPWHWNENR